MQSATRAVDDSHAAAFADASAAAYAADLPSDDTWSDRFWPAYTVPSITEQRAAITAAQDKVEAAEALITMLGGIVLFGIGVSAFILAQLP